MNIQPNITPQAVEAGVPVSGVANGEAFWQLRNDNTRKIGLTYLEIIIAAATTTVTGLIRPATNGTASNSTLGVSVGLVIGTADVAFLATAWAAQPTYDAIPLYIRQALLAAAIGNKVVWTWPEDNPLVIDAGATLVLQNITGGVMSPARVSARWLVGV